MKTILVIDDNSPAARHAAEFALGIAQKVLADILLLNTAAVSSRVARKVVAGDMENELYGAPVSETLAHLRAINEQEDCFKPGIEEFMAPGLDEAAVSDFINKNNVWMIVKGMPDAERRNMGRPVLNIHAVLNRVLCPLLLVPECWALKDIERMVYIADLRYCALQIVRYVASVAKQYGAAMSIAHISAKGLPDMAEKYALDVFSQGISNKINYDHVFFNNIREKNLNKAVDVLIHGMRNDILVLANHRFHFEEIVGRYITETLPIHISIPLLIFPY